MPQCQCTETTKGVNINNNNVLFFFFSTILTLPLSLSGEIIGFVAIALP
jgi:hypothetical protein